MNNNLQLRKVQLTINNPIEHEFDHKRIKSELGKLKSCVYWIMCDEVGGKDGTYHTHVYVVFKAPVRFSTIKNKFPTAHIEKAIATHADNINYILKEGRWKNSEKSCTSIPNTVEECGQRPSDANGKDVKLSILYSLVKDGYSNYEILEMCSDYLFDTDKIDRVRLTIRQEEYKNTFRDLEVTYIYGRTGLGKSRYVMEKYGYANVFRVTDYEHPFDTYEGQDVIVFEEFASSICIRQMLNYCDGYPLKLPCRYTDKAACFTKVYIISNTSLEKQYTNVREEQFDVWQAFIRRITKVMLFKKNSVITYDDTDEYFERDRKTDLPVKHMDF